MFVGWLFIALLVALIGYTCWGYCTRVVVTDHGVAPLIKCESCQYDLEGLPTAGVCPECGGSYRPRSQVTSRRVYDIGRASVLVSVITALGCSALFLAMEEEITHGYSMYREFNRAETATIQNRGVHLGGAASGGLLFAAMVFLAGAKLRGARLAMSVFASLVVVLPMSVVIGFVVEPPNPYHHRNDPSPVIAFVVLIGLPASTIALYAIGRWLRSKPDGLKADS